MKVLGTISMLRQQNDWVGLENDIFADIQYLTYADIVNGVGQKNPKICWRNIKMVP